MALALKQLTIDGCDPVDGRPAVRVCKCSRKEPIDHLPAHVEYLDRNCRQRFYRERVRAEMERVGLPASPSLRAARVSRPTSTHNGDAETARKQRLGGKPSGLQVSFPRAVETLASEFSLPPERVDAALRLALPDLQRQRLEDRRAA